ncbi:MAG TPA: MOSC N-terminal beta barrel domain-containing protein [Capillimicrobium sp.]|nr:MOSC N-terminal beta barrel domain-containing protein [Capillimicrobium sp.]
MTELHRWPVKSLAGEPVDVLRVDPRGAAGDRAHALTHTHKGATRLLTAREAPRMLAWSATYGGADVVPDGPPEPVLTAPDGERYAWSDPALAAALRADLGRDVALRRDVAGQQDLPDSLLVTTAATLAAVEAELGRPLDLRRFRTNVHVELDAPPFAENGWEGRRMRVGDLELELLHPCVRCVIPTRDPDTQVKWAGLLRHLVREHGGIFGINARPLGPATVRRGDPVAVHDNLPTSTFG